MPSSTVRRCDTCRWCELSGPASCVRFLQPRPRNPFSVCHKWEPRGRRQPTGADTVGAIPRSTDDAASGPPEPSPARDDAGCQVGVVRDADVPGEPADAQSAYCMGAIEGLVVDSGVVQPITGATLHTVVMVCRASRNGLCPHPCALGKYSDSLLTALQAMRRHGPKIIQEVQ